MQRTSVERDHSDCQLACEHVSAANRNEAQFSDFGLFQRLPVLLGDGMDFDAFPWQFHRLQLSASTLGGYVVQSLFFPPRHILSHVERHLVALSQLRIGQGCPSQFLSNEMPKEQFTNPF
ncbi:MAG: hypothetical protein KJ072_08510 [Verrucomicrobia bacterium]|nr:hypothetical protein [Verrucomicrobiota bacterium]